MALTLADLVARRAALMEGVKPTRPTVYVGLGTCGIAAGGQAVYDAVQAGLQEFGLDAGVVKVGCIGMCEQEVLLDIERPGEDRVTYAAVTPDRVRRLLTEHLRDGRPVTEWSVGTVATQECPYPQLDFYAKQRRIVLKKCGFVDPESLDSYLAHGGYGALIKVLGGMEPDAVIEEVRKSGLRGRGGAGFPTGQKWFFTRQAPGSLKYVVCNGDEGDPGAFMDRSVLEGDPYAVIEGMTIAAHAIGASEGYLYVRAEYPLAIARLKLALAQAGEVGLLGDDILGTGLSFHLKLKEGAGAFVCGEETALLASIEGERGMPRPRPPFPATRGLWGKPTNINNVETFANVPEIILQGADAFAALGTAGSRGTKVFALTGKVARTGLAEVPMGMSLREVIFAIGGGIQRDRAFKAVQIGGPSGGCLPTALLDTPIDYDSLTAAGAMMGSGGLVVLDESTCMVDLARFFLNFTQSESCGKCTPCREGTKRMLELLTALTEGKGSHEDLVRLERLAAVVKDSSLCGLGQTAPNPVLSTLRYFREEYEAHVAGHCPAGVCVRLTDLVILAEACKGCGACKKVCPTGAIAGELKAPHTIDTTLCIKCGACITACAFEAITRR